MTARVRDAVAADIVTFGCRLNIVESEAIRQQAERAGLSDLAIVNTCAVTSEATRQARQAIRRLKRERPERPVIVTGCAAQIEPEVFARLPETDLVLGNAEKMQAETWTRLARSNSLKAAALSPADKLDVGDIMAEAQVTRPAASASRAITRAASCRCRMAATTAAPSASSPSGAVAPARSPSWRRWRNAAP